MLGKHYPRRAKAARVLSTAAFRLRRDVWRWHWEGTWMCSTVPQQHRSGCVRGGQQDASHCARRCFSSLFLRQLPRPLCERLCPVCLRQRTGTKRSPEWGSARGFCLSLLLGEASERLQLSSAGVGVTNVSAGLSVPRSMLPDAVDDFMLRNPSCLNLEALFYSFYVFFNKFAGGLAVGISTLSLQ